MKKKRLFVIICSVLILALTATGVFAAKKDDKVPTRVKVIAQSCTAAGLCLTVIDLDQNEIVILFYASLPGSPFRTKLELVNIIRTGMFVDPEEQVAIIGQDAPFEEEKAAFQDPGKQHMPQTPQIPQGPYSPHSPFGF
jgi:hypothetical protein